MSHALSEIADEKNELEMTPMIDVTFLLLIFFMCTLKFRVLEGKLDAALPHDVGAGRCFEPAVETLAIQCRVANEGTKMRWDAGTRRLRPISDAEAQGVRRFEYAADRVIEYTLGSVRTAELAEVRELLVQAQRAAGESGEPGARVKIDPRDGIVQGDVIRLLDLVIETGIREVRFAAPRAR